MHWISVKDQLPIKDGIYLIYASRPPVYGYGETINYIDTVPFRNSQFHSNSECCREEEPLEHQPTHWMPLPEPPITQERNAKPNEIVNNIIDKFEPVLTRLSKT